MVKYIITLPPGLGKNYDEHFIKQRKTKDIYKINVFINEHLIFTMSGNYISKN